MNCATVVSSIGLSLDIVGVALLFKYGLPARVREKGGILLLWPGGKSYDEAGAEYQHYKRMSYAGLTCLIVGFTLQLISNFLS